MPGTATSRWLGVVSEPALLAARIVAAVLAEWTAAMTYGAEDAGVEWRRTRASATSPIAPRASSAALPGACCAHQSARW